jgi:hypothetical protein
MSANHEFDLRAARAAGARRNARKREPPSTFHLDATGGRSCSTGVSHLLAAPAPDFSQDFEISGTPYPWRSYWPKNFPEHTPEGYP